MGYFSSQVEETCLSRSIIKKNTFKFLLHISIKPLWTHGSYFISCLYYKGPLPSVQCWKNLVMIELSFSPLGARNSGGVICRGLTSLQLCVMHKGFWDLQSVKTVHLQDLFCRETEHLGLKHPEGRCTKSEGSTSEHP